MRSEVKLSKRAEKDLEIIQFYLITQWSEKVALQFLDKFERTKKVLSQNPYAFPRSTTRKDVRRCVLTKHNIIYYTVLKDTVNIITLHDTRQNPQKLKL